ncbi:hypothetical protein Zm00014a_042020 [Zea mays]|uniref:Uncharacterized protein n=1 Tax=Zea mays TaxID=4577 RepID=A0A3L6DVM2_MAIZE|nr:hypothetical protein Zm00014a_042020 [Zea mays]
MDKITRGYLLVNAFCERCSVS